MIKIVGFQHKEGNFKDPNGREVIYNNVILSYVSDCVNSVVGLSVGELKIPFENIKAVTGLDYSLLPELLNKVVELSYIPVGKYQQLASVKIVPDPETEKGGK